MFYASCPVVVFSDRVKFMFIRNPLNLLVLHRYTSKSLQDIRRLWNISISTLYHTSENDLKLRMSACVDEKVDCAIGKCWQSCVENKMPSVVDDIGYEEYEEAGKESAHHEEQVLGDFKFLSCDFV